MAHPGLYPLLPSLAALSELTLNESDVDGRRVIELTEDKELMTQLMDLKGIEIILKRVLKVGLLADLRTLFSFQTKDGLFGNPEGLCLCAA